MNPPKTRLLSKLTDLLGLMAALGLVAAAAGLGNAATMSSVDGWYQTLDRPGWAPPDWVFGPMWTVLYAMMAVAAWLVWRAKGIGAAKWPLGLFFTQLVLNTLWSVLFFGLQRPAWALAEIIVLWTVILATTIMFWRHSRRAAALLLPYLAWVAFAAALNFEFARLNG